MPSTQAPSSDNLLLGKGAVYFKKNAASNNTGEGFIHLGNVESFDLIAEVDVVDKYESMSSEANLYKSAVRRRTFSCKIQGSEFSKENLALACLGSTTWGNQAATPVTSENLTTNALHGATYRTAKLGPISAVLVKKGANNLVLNNDYTIPDAATGLIKLAAVSANFVTGDTLLVDYTPTAYNNNIAQVEGGISAQTEGMLLFVGDPAAGPAVMVEIWKVLVMPAGQLGLISEDWAQFQLGLKVLLDLVNHAANPVFRVTYL